MKSFPNFARTLGVAVALLAIVSSGAAQQKQPEPSDDEVVRVETNLVTVPISVLDRNGRFIPGLTQEQFHLFENGIAQDIAYFDSADRPFTVALLLDISDSTKFKLKEIQDAAIAFTEQLRPEDRVIIVAFDSRVNVVSEPTSDREALQKAIRRIKSGGGTSLYSAVKIAVSERLNRIRGRKAIVLFTDGVDTTSKSATYEETLHTAQELDALIYTIQYNTYSDLTASNVNEGFNGAELMTAKGEPLQVAYTRAKRYLNLLAEKSGGRPFFADSIERLQATFARIAQELRQQYSIGFYPKHDAGDDGARQLKIKIDQPGVVVRTRRSYVFKAPLAP
jgi:Ca-activated chloride channel family protein